MLSNALSFYLSDGAASNSHACSEMHGERRFKSLVLKVNLCCEVGGVNLKIRNHPFLSWILWEEMCGKSHGVAFRWSWSLTNFHHFCCLCLVLSYCLPCLSHCAPCVLGNHHYPLHSHPPSWVWQAEALETLWGWIPPPTSGSSCLACHPHRESNLWAETSMPTMYPCPTHLSASLTPPQQPVWPGPGLPRSSPPQLVPAGLSVV